MTGIRRLSGVPELLDVSGNDAYVHADADPDRIHSAWAHGEGAYGWLIPSRRVAGRLHLTTYGAAGAAADLLVQLREHVGLGVGAVTLPRDADRSLPPPYSVRPRNDWEWLATSSPPPVQPHESEVRWLDDVPAEELRAFLRRWSPRHDVEPGDHVVRRWCGVRNEAGAIIAVAAHLEYVPRVPHLASIATSGDFRGQGYGAAVTAWITRALLAEGTGWVTLGMYSDNDIARRMYYRLGYRCEHFFTSGGLMVRGNS